MRFIAILTPVPDATEDDFARYSLQEERHLWPLYVQGIVRHMYFQSDPLRVVLDFEAENRATVAAQIAALPMMVAGLGTVEIIELGPWLPLTILFGPQASEG